MVFTFIKKQIKNFWPFIKYCIVGALGTAIDVLALYFFFEVLEFPLLISTTLAFLVAATNNFIWNKTWTFKNKSKNYRKLYLKFLIVSVVGLALTNVLMYFLVETLHIWYIAAKLLTSMIVLVWNFLGNKYWTFQLKKHLVHLLNGFDYDISIVIPAYNEENRIKTTLLTIQDYLKELPLKSEILVIDDGSRDQTSEIVQQKQKIMKELKLISLKKNHGKGYAVKRGIEFSRGEYILFTDADNSTPIEDLGKLLSVIQNGETDIAIGSRYIQGSDVRIKQSRFRVMIGRLGNRLIRLFLISGIRDTQCGFKLFKHNVAKEIFSRQKVKRWGFDMEALAIAKMLDYRVMEIPVSWFNSPESRMRPVRDGLKTFLELIYIKLNLWSGRYR